MDTSTKTKRRKTNWLQYRYLAERPFHASDADAAKAIGVAASTVANWNADPEFQAAVQAFWDGQLEASREQLMTLRDKAIVRLNALLDVRDPRTRLRAVTEVLNRCGLEEVVALDLSPALASLLAEAGEAADSTDKEE